MNIDKPQIFIHFIGASTFASDFISMIMRLFKEINFIVTSHGGVTQQLPTTDEKTIVEHIPIFFQLIARYTV